MLNIRFAGHFRTSTREENNSASLCDERTSSSNELAPLAAAAHLYRA
jgi:hypothetical protein